MVLSKKNQTTIAISKRNRQVLSELGKKGQSFDNVLSEVLNKVTADREENKEVRQPKFRVERSGALTTEGSNTQTALESSWD